MRAKTLTRAVLALLGAGVLLYAAAVAVMSTAWFHRSLAARVVSSLESLTGARVQLGGLDVQPAIFQATLRGLVLHGTEPASEPPLLSAQTVVVGINPLSALRRKLLLRRLDGEDVEVRIQTYPDGSTNVPGPRGDFLGDLLDLSIGTLTVARSSLFWGDQRVPLEASARHVAVLLRHDRPRRYSGAVAFSETRFETPRWSLPPVTFATQLEFSSAWLRLPALHFRVPGKAGGVSGQGAFSLQRLPAIEAELSLQAKGEIPLLARTLRIPELEGGSFNGEGHVSYRSGEFAGRGRVRASRVSIHSGSVQPAPFDLASDYAFDRRHVALTQWTVSLLGGRAQGRGDVRLEGPLPMFTLTAQLHELDLGKALRAVSGGEALLAFLPVASRLDGAVDAAWRGQLRDFTSKFDLSLVPPAEAPASRPLSGFARGTATIAPSPSVNLTEAELHTPHSSLKARGTLGATQSNLAVEFATSDFEEDRRPMEAMLGASQPLPVLLKSSAAFSGAVLGSLSHPEIRGRLELGPFEYRGWSWSDFEANVIAAPNQLRVSEGKLLAGASAVRFDVSAGLDRWELTPGSPLRIAVEAEGASLEGLRDALNLHAAVSGQLTCRLVLEGTRSSLGGSGAVRIERGAVSQEPFDSLAATVRVDGFRWALEGIELRKGAGKVTGRASIDASRREFSAEVHGTDFSLAEIKALPGPGAQGSGASRAGVLEGRLSFDLRAHGTRENPQLQADIALRGARFNATSLGDFEGQAGWEGRRIEFEGNLQGPGGVLRVAGRVQTQDQWPLQVTAKYANFRADPWIDLLRGGRLKVAITASGSVDCSGPLKGPGGLEVRGRADKLEVGVADLMWQNDRPVNLAYADRVLTVSPFGLRGPSTDLEIEGSIHWAEPATMSFAVEGHGDAKLLKILSPALESAGNFDLTLHAGGNPVEPALDGTLSIRNLSLGYADLPFRLAGLNGEIQLSGDRFTIRSLRAARGGSSIDVTGSGTLFGTPKIDLQANFNQARVEFPTQITSSLSGNLHLTGTPEGGQLAGQLTIRQMFVSEDFNWIAWIGQVGGRPLAQPSGIASPVASKIRLDVEVSSDPEVRLETPSHDLTLVATIDMKAQGTLANPVGFGNIHIQSGEVVAPRGDHYKLTRGDISFTNPFRTQVFVDLEAQTRIQHYDLTVDVTGPLDHLKPSYHSDPPLPTSDVLGLLVGGSPREQQAMTASGSSSQAARTMGASLLLQQALSSQVSGRIRRLFGISQLKIDPNVYGPGAGAGPRVTFQEQIARDFTITYSTNTAGTVQRVIQIEYDLSDRISLVGERDQNGVLGVEVRFRHRFR
jgi:autotransporter translocation and assembly factor TamB